MNDQAILTVGIPAAGGLLALLCLFFALRAVKRQRLIDNLPTSKTTGVFIGLVELKGTAEAEKPLVGYLAGQNCVYYRWNVDEHWSRTVTETYTDDKGRSQTRTRTESGWTTVASGGEETPFYVKDDCGIIQVQPARAKVEPVTTLDHTCGIGDAMYYGKGPAGAIADTEFRRRFVERAILLHAQLYVMGHARERDDIVAPEIAYDPKAEMFLISTRSEEQVSKGLRWQFWLLGLLGLALAVGGFVIRDAQLKRVLDEYVGTYILVGIAYLVAWPLGWAWMAYNSMIDLRQRVQQAWANVDVQLKRRADLIPNLVGAVQGLRDYEQKVQTEVAQLRAQLTATPPGDPGPDHQAVATMVGAVIERYPELKANTSFMNLQQNLIDTEQRVALARGYFNDIATFYNTRLQILPDRFICALGAMKPQVLMSAESFERAPVEVKFAA
jgi:hypothetical protein